MNATTLLVNMSTATSTSSLLVNSTMMMSPPPGLVNGGSFAQTPLTLFLLQLWLVTVLSKLIGLVLQRIYEPMVIAEMLAGIILGPSVLGQIPGFTAAIFPPASIGALAMVAQYGLVLFMFTVGLQQDLDMFTKAARRSFATAVIGVIVPMIVGIPFAIVTDDPVYHSTNIGIYIVFVGLLAGVSALPVLARIVSEFDFLATPLGVFTMSATAFDDLIAWPVLAAITALASSTGGSLTALWIVISLVLEALVLWFIVRPLLRVVVRIFGGHNTRNFSESAGAAVMVVFVAVAFISEMIGVTALVGAYICGCLVPRQGHMVTGLLDRIEWVITNAFVPVYFAISGLRTQLGLLNSAHLWGLTVFLVVTACFGKMSGCSLSARYIGQLSWLDSGMFAVLMNTKGLVALVTVNIGLDAKIITRELFAMSIVMILFNTLLTGPLVNGVYRCVKKSNFLDDIQDAKHGAEVGVIVAVGHERADIAAETVRVSSLLYGDRRDRSALHVWRITDQQDHQVMLRRAYARRLAAQVGLHLNDPAAKASSAAGRTAGIKVRIKAHISDSTLPADLCRIANESAATSIVLAATDIGALASPQIQTLVSEASCDVVVVVPAVAAAFAAADEDPSSSDSGRSSTTQQQGTRIVVAYGGSVHDDLALDVAIGASSREHPLLVIKLASPSEASDEATARIVADVEQQFLQRAMAGSNIDVVWRSTFDDFLNRVIVELSASTAPAVLIVGFDSPLLPHLAAKPWRCAIACTNSPAAAVLGIARANTTVHANMQTARRGSVGGGGGTTAEERRELADLFEKPTSMTTTTTTVETRRRRVRKSSRKQKRRLQEDQHESQS